MKLANSLDVRQLIETEWFDQFNFAQQKEIEEGLSYSIPVELYAKPQFTARQMKVLRSALLDDVRIDKLLNARISARKMRILSDAMKCGIDISPILSPKINCQVTKQYIATMKLKKNLDKFNQFSTKKLIIKFEDE